MAALAAEEFAAELSFSPTTATWLGDHRFDDRLDDVRADAVARELNRLRDLKERVAQAAAEIDSAPGPGGSGDAAQKLDLLLLAARLDSQLLDLSDPGPYERNPAFYMNLVATSLDGLLGPDFTPVEGRVRPLLRRLLAVPELCREAQKNLKNPPEIFTRRGIEMALSTRDFLTTLLPRLVHGAADPKLVEEFNHVNDEARKALDDFAAWLNHDLLPRSKGDFTLGKERLLARLRAAELLDVSLETVQERAERDLKDARRRLDSVLLRLNQDGVTSGRQLSDAMHALEDDHPRADELIHTAEATLSGLYDIVVGENLLTLTAARPHVTEMPPYRWGYALLVLPGPLESRVRESFFYIDPVDPGWKDKKKINDHLRLLNRTQLLLTSIHEIVPGHLLEQDLARHASASLRPARQHLRSIGFIEGWAHYAEQLMTENWPPPGNDKLELLALRVQVWRLGRLIVALRLHAPPAGGPGPASRLDEATRFLVDECYLDDYAARREAERATYDPMYLLPALGRLQMVQFHHDYQAERGDSFSLQGFHDALLAEGELPVVALRQILLSHAGPSLVIPPPTP